MKRMGYKSPSHQQHKMSGETWRDHVLLAMKVTTDAENASSGSNEKQRRINSGNNISGGPCSRSQIKFPYMPTFQNNIVSTGILAHVF